MPVMSSTISNQTGSAVSSFITRSTTGLVRNLAQAYLRQKKPVIIAVAGSVGKTSTKLALAHLLKTEKSVSCMDDSYNNGIGLYLSVFERKVPTSLHSPLAWLKIFAHISKWFLKAGPDYIILEYGIDHPGDMDELVAFARPDIAILTAVTPEHMEYLIDIDTVGREETKVLAAARDFSVANSTDIDAKYLAALDTEPLTYGSDEHDDAMYAVAQWRATGAVVDFNLDGLRLDGVAVSFITEPLIRQLSGAALLAKKLGVSETGLRSGLETVQPAASRMRLLEAMNGAMVIDDSTNFSPIAGIEAIKALKRLPAKRHIAVLGNMHELGEYGTTGFAEVADEFADLSVLAFVGELARDNFMPKARELGFVDDENLFYFNDAIDAGMFLRQTLRSDDIVLVKGPFGGYYLEEAVRMVLRNKDDRHLLTRQSDFWQRKKRSIFGDKFNESY